MEIRIDFINLICLALLLVGLVETKFEVRISKYQIDNLRNIANSLSLDPNLFSRSRGVNNVVMSRIIDINKRYEVILDSILSFENWIRRFSSEYYGNTYKNKDILALIISISAEFEILKLKFNELSDDIDVFIDKVLSKDSSKCISNEKHSRIKYNKELECFYRQLVALNLELKRLVSYQHKLITSSSLYVVRLDNGTIQVDSSKDDQVVDMSNENSLYDLWVYYEHHRLPNLREKIIFISKCTSLLIRQDRILLEFLQSRYKELTDQYSEVVDSLKDDYSLLYNSKLTKMENLRVGSNKSQQYNQSEPNTKGGITSMKQQQQFFRKCLDADELGIIVPLDSVSKVDGWGLNVEFENVSNMIHFLIKELESKCTEFQKNYDILSDYITFISENLEVNTTNINDLFFSGKNNFKKSVFAQLTYQVSQLNTISEFANTLEEKLKSYHYFNVPCYYGIVNYYLKQSFNKFYNIFNIVASQLAKNGNFTANSYSGVTAETMDNSTLPQEIKWTNITITDEMTSFMFNISAIASSAGVTGEFNKFPNFGTKYDFTILTNLTFLAPNSDIGGLSEHLETLSDRFLKNSQLHEKRVSEGE
ncbi:putative signal peptide-containing protein [Cryptosporidium canis]|uniref:Signal peptide-containing protein n=1 Tax=Cryptosporidium canis TaxID=195482 RepID=A0A9D5DHM3_9CRYT|nr:putative signal peptide-containing protein [Cryptosporidium canis]